MARIRTIKPELPQSESMGKISRDARLLFILTWTLADDSGRLRGSSRMLASLLFPYDDDAPELIDQWLAELAAEGCIDIYSAGSSTYIQISKWLNHQKIDKPSPSKIPAFDESSRTVAKVRGGIKDQGSRIKDQGKGIKGSKDQIVGAPPPVEQTQLDQARTIFAYWQKTMNSPKSVMDAKRQGLIVRALKNYQPGDICKAIRGCSKSPHNMGVNDRSTKFNGIGLILRDAENIDRFISLDAGGARAAVGAESMEAANARVMAEVLGGSAADVDDLNTIEMEPA